MVLAGTGKLLVSQSAGDSLLASLNYEYRWPLSLFEFALAILIAIKPRMCGIMVIAGAYVAAILAVRLMMTVLNQDFRCGCVGVFSRGEGLEPVLAGLMAIGYAFWVFPDEAAPLRDLK
jgi:hypothetical protein